MALPNGVSQSIPTSVIFLIRRCSNMKAAFNWNGLVNISQEEGSDNAKRQKMRFRVLQGIISLILCTSNVNVLLLTASRAHLLGNLNPHFTGVTNFTQMGMTISMRVKHGWNSAESDCTYCSRAKKYHLSWRGVQRALLISASRVNKWSKIKDLFSVFRVECMKVYSYV